MAEPVDPLLQSLPGRLKAARAALGLSLDAVSKRSGVSRSMVSQIERGESSPTISTLWNLTRALQVGKVKLVAEQCIYTADELLCRGEIKLATLHSDTQALIAMPEPLREALQQERVKAFTECA